MLKEFAYFGRLEHPKTVSKVHGSVEDAGAGAYWKSGKGSTINRDDDGLCFESDRLGVVAALALLSGAAHDGAVAGCCRRAGWPAYAGDHTSRRIFGSQSVSQSSYQGSLVTDKPTGSVMDLSLDEAIQHGLQHNLGIILQGSQQEAAAGARLQQLQALLPTVDAQAKIQVQQINLAAEGFKFPGINPIVGPFQVVDFRAYLTWSLFNVASLENFIAARHNFEERKLSAQDARDMVVLTVGNAYLMCVADAARVTSVGSELQTTQVSLDQANSNHDAGTSPKLDVLRAQVDNQNLQQQMIVAQNQLAKDKLALARVIGLPLAQEFNLTDSGAVCSAGCSGCGKGRGAGARESQGPAGDGGAVEGGAGAEEGGVRAAAAGCELQRGLRRYRHDAPGIRMIRIRRAERSPRRCCRSPRRAAMKRWLTRSIASCRRSTAT